MLDHFFLIWPKRVAAVFPLLKPDLAATTSQSTCEEWCQWLAGLGSDVGSAWELKVEVHPD
jgi:hypothetical protein